MAKEITREAKEKVMDKLDYLAFEINILAQKAEESNTLGWEANENNMLISRNNYWTQSKEYSRKVLSYQKGRAKLREYVINGFQSQVRKK